MKEKELMEIALRMVAKGYVDGIRDCDDLYDATDEEKDKCMDYANQVQQIGLVAFRELINKKDE